MVRMSDLVRGIVREKRPESPREDAAAAGTPASVPPALPPTRLAQGPARRAAAPPAPEPAPAAAPPAPAAAPAPVEGPAERAEPLFLELVQFLGRVRELMRAGEPFPWDALERLMGRVHASLERSGDLFWVANAPAPQAGADYLALHQARVAVLSLRIGADVGYDRPRLVRLGMAGALMDVGLWQLPESLWKRLDALSPEEQTQYRSHPSLSAEWLRRWAPHDDGLAEAVLQHHEREQA